MLEAVRGRVKPKALSRRGFRVHRDGGPEVGASRLPPCAGRGRLSPPIRCADVPVLTLFFLAVLVVALGTAWWVWRRGRQHRNALLRLLDAADAFEARLRAARSEIETATGAEDETVRTALQEMLRQRLWLQEYGQTASSKRLDDMRASMEAARQRIDQQLSVIESARRAAP